jgi:hypothetical protein
MKNLLGIIILMLMVVFTSSCSEDFLEQTPSDRPSEDVLFASLEGAKIHLIGIYSLQNYYYGEGTRGIIAPDVMGDDALVVSSRNYSRYIFFYNYSFSTTNSRPWNFWRYSYRTISNCNLFLEQITDIEGDETVKKDLMAQAYALRAFAYFNLVRWFGETAYTDDPGGRGVIINNTVNSLDGYNIPRSTVGEVYAQIIADLTEAEKGAVGADYKGFIDASGVAAIQARVYLTMGDWANASKYAKKAYAGFSLIDEATYLSGFSDVSSEDIWSQKFDDSDTNIYLSIPSFTYTSDDITYDEDWKGPDGEPDGVIDIYDVYIGKRGADFVFGYNSIRITRALIDLFEDTDFRKKMFPINLDPAGNPIMLDADNGIISHAQYTTADGHLTTKWKSRTDLGTGDFSRIRASEMYLIEAEAEARLGNDGPAQDALLEIQQRADATVTEVTETGQALIDKVLLERRKELFLEGHRFFDLKRLDMDLDRTGSASDHWSDFTDIGLADPNIVPKNSLSQRFCLPIPQDEIDSNEALTDQDQNNAFK